MYSFKTATRLYGSILFVSLMFLIVFAPTNVPHRTSVNIRAALGVVGGLLASVIVPNVVALVMTRVLGKGMSWFSREWYCIVLYGTPALTGNICHRFWPHRSISHKSFDRNACFSALDFFPSPSYESATPRIRYHVDRPHAFCDIGFALPVFQHR